MVILLFLVCLKCNTLKASTRKKGLLFSQLKIVEVCLLVKSNHRLPNGEFVPLGGSKVDSVFYTSKIDEISTREKISNCLLVVAL